MKISMLALSGVVYVAALPAVAQRPIDRPVNIQNTNTRITNYGVQVQTVDANGTPFKALAYDAQGTPFYTDTWLQASLWLTTGKVYHKVSVRIDLIAQTLHFVNTAGTEMYLDAANLQRVELAADPAKPDSITAIFKTFFTQRTGQPGAAFYEVLAAGKITLLKKSNKKIVSSKNEFTQEVTREIVDYTDYWVFKDNVMEDVKKKESFWEKLMQDKWSTVDAYISKQELSYKSYDDLRSIVQYYNGLQ